MIPFLPAPLALLGVALDKKKQVPRATKKSPAAVSAADTAPAALPETTENLLHELRTHQIELEMQNRALQDSQVALEQSRDQYLDLYDFSPVGYLTLSRDGVISEINLPACTLLGVTHKKILRRRFVPFVALADNENWQKHFLYSLHHPETQTCELELRKANGDPFYAKLDCLRVATEGMPPMLRVAITDVTGHRNTEKSLKERDHDLSESQRIAHLGSWERDRTTGRIAWSDEVHRIAGIPLGLLGDSFDDFLAGVHANDREMARKAFADSAGDISPPDIEYRVIRRSDGVERWCQTSFDRERNNQGQTTRTVGTVLDITDRKILEVELRRTNAELEQFVYLAAHDLREPLRMLSSYLGLIEKRLGPQLEDDLKTYFGFVIGGAKRMNLMITNILKLRWTREAGQETMAS